MVMRTWPVEGFNTRSEAWKGGIKRGVKPEKALCKGV